MCPLASVNPRQSVPCLNLTCAKYQFGEIDRSGRISRCGDEMMRVYEAAQSMLRSKKWSWLKAWAMQPCLGLCAFALLKNASPQSAQAITGARQGGTNKKYFELARHSRFSHC
jgi:transposase